MEPLLSVTEYQVLLGRTLTGAKLAQAEQFLKIASDLVRKIARPHLDGVDHTEASDAIKGIVYSMTRRGIDNPLGLETERIADYSRGGMQGIYATDDEREQIEEAVEKPVIGHFHNTAPLPYQMLEKAGQPPLGLPYGGFYPY